MFASGIAGYCCMGYWQGKKMEERKRIYVDAYHNGEEPRRSIQKPAVSSSPSNSESSRISSRVGKKNDSKDSCRFFSVCYYPYQYNGLLDFAKTGDKILVDSCKLVIDVTGLV